MYKKLNYAIGDVASTTAIDATTLTLKAGHTITTDTGETNKFVAVFYDGTKSSPYQDTNREIVEAYRTNTNDFVIARAKESTSAKEWVENDKFMLIASAGVFDEYETEIASKEDALGYTAENVANKKTNLVDNSDTYYPTQKAVKTAVDAKQDTLTFGIANTNAVKIDDASVADNDYAKFTANGIEGVPYSTVLSDIGAQAALGYTAENAANKVISFQGTPDDNHYISEKLAYNQLALKANLISPSFTTPNIGAATGTSLALEGTNLGILTLKNTTATDYTRMLFDGTGTDFSQGVGNASAAITDLQNKFYIYDFTNSKTAFTIVPNTLAAKFYGSLEATNLSGSNTGDESDASTTVKGIVELAEASEVNTGTSTSLAITPDALAGSNAFTKTVQQVCVDFATELAVADGVGYIVIPAECNGMNLISARADVITAGTTNASTFDIYNVTDSTSMLSSAISIASAATSGTGTVDTAHDDVATGDVIRFDCDTLSTTKPKGLIISLAFRLP